jgi:hypothetical protein
LRNAVLHAIGANASHGLREQQCRQAQSGSQCCSKTMNGRFVETVEKLPTIVLSSAVRWSIRSEKSRALVIITT